MSEEADPVGLEPVEAELMEPDAVEEPLGSDAEPDAFAFAEEEQELHCQEVAPNHFDVEEEYLQVEVEDATKDDLFAAEPEQEGDGYAELEMADASTNDDTQNHPEREDDLKLEDLPEEQRLAVEGNMKLKKMLSCDLPSSSALKKRRLEKDPLRAGVLSKWGLENDLVVTYVLQAADIEDVEALRDSYWKPSVGQQKSLAEQVNNKIGMLREQMFPSSGSVDTVEAFMHTWKLSGSVKELLLGLNHKDLRYVITRYSQAVKLSDLVEEAAMTMPRETQDKAEDAAPEKPGLLTMSRFNRLELIDPCADALVVGDANLTFSLVLAAHREGLGHVGRMVATTFETIEILRGRYPEIDSTVKILEDKSAEVLHNVDCTRLAVDPRFKDMSGKFGAVYYNFPHAGVVQGFFDGHPFVRWRHENLMSLFFAALRTFVKPGGLVKVSSNSRATGVRFTDIIGAAVHNEFRHVETVPFLEWQLRNYRRSYGDRRDSERRPEDGEIYRNQRGNSDMVYSFCYLPTGKPNPAPTIRQPPSKQLLHESQEGKLGKMKAEEKKRRVEEIYDLFLTYVQGVHVG